VSDQCDLFCLGREENDDNNKKNLDKSMIDKHGAAATAPFIVHEFKEEILHFCFKKLQTSKHQSLETWRRIDLVR